MKSYARCLCGDPECPSCGPAQGYAEPASRSGFGIPPASQTDEDYEPPEEE